MTFPEKLIFDQDGVLAASFRKSPRRAHIAVREHSREEPGDRLISSSCLYLLRLVEGPMQLLARDPHRRRSLAFQAGIRVAVQAFNLSNAPEELIDPTKASFMLALRDYEHPDDAVDIKSLAFDAHGAHPEVAALATSAGGYSWGKYDRLAPADTYISIGIGLHLFDQAYHLEREVATGMVRIGLELGWNEPGSVTESPEPPFLD